MIEAFEYLIGHREIGDGFRDGHINATIKSAAETHGLRFFNINPDGARQAEKLREASPREIQSATNLERIFVGQRCDASRRHICEICEGDNIELQKPNEFFEV